MSTLRALVADIGGTSARFALVDPDSMQPDCIQKLSNDDFPRLEDAVRAYLENQNAGTISRACLAVAGPEMDGKVQFTNSPWSIDAQSFRKDFGLEVLEIINDFAAQALAVPHLQSHELLPIGSARKPRSGENRLVLGPGTGLGVCGLVQTVTGWRALPAEGGSSDFAPHTERDISLWRFLRKKTGGKVCWERALSGSGLELMYQAHSSLNGEQKSMAAVDISRMALEEPDSLAFQVVEHFCELLGHFAGNAALITGARGGVYIAGGIAPKIQGILDQGAFRKAFIQKERMAEYLDAIPTWLVLAEEPGLVGAAAWLNANRSL